MSFIVEGSVRGNCGHKHRTLSGAVKCLERDQNGRHSQHGYSDRSIYEIDEAGNQTLLIRTGDGKYDYEREPDVDYV